MIYNNDAMNDTMFYMTILRLFLHCYCMLLIADIDKLRNVVGYIIINNREV